MDALPFCVFKRADRPCFLVKFKDEAGNYLPPVSTKKKDRDEAVQVAFKLLQDGIHENLVRFYFFSSLSCRLLFVEGLWRVLRGFCRLSRNDLLLCRYFLGVL